MLRYEIGISTPGQPVRRFDRLAAHEWPAVLALLQPVTELIGLRRLEIETCDAVVVIQAVDSDDAGVVPGDAGICAGGYS